MPHDPDPRAIPIAHALLAEGYNPLQVYRIAHRRLKRAAMVEHAAKTGVEGRREGNDGQEGIGRADEKSDGKKTLIAIVAKAG